MSRDTVAYIVQAVYHDLQRIDPNFKQALSVEHIPYIVLRNNYYFVYVGCALACVVLAVFVSIR